MPIYEYNCANCGEKFEALLRRAREEVKCPKCKGTTLRRLFSTFSARAAFKRPPCEGSVPSCSESRCRSGTCDMLRE